MRLVPHPSRAVLVLIALAGGAVALVVTLTGSLVAGLLAGLLTLATALVVIRDRTAGDAVPDPSRRRYLRLARKSGSGLSPALTSCTTSMTS